MCLSALPESGNINEPDSVQRFSHQSLGLDYKVSLGQRENLGGSKRSTVLSIGPEKGETENKIGTLQVMLEELQRIVGAQVAMDYHVVGSWCERNNVSDRVLSYSRHGIVACCDKPIVFPRTRSAISDAQEGHGILGEIRYVSLIGAEADCNLEDFEKISRVIKSRFSSSVFQPAFKGSQSPMPRLEHAQMFFNSL